MAMDLAASGGVELEQQATDGEMRYISVRLGCFGAKFKFRSHNWVQIADLAPEIDPAHPHYP